MWMKVIWNGFINIVWFAIWINHESQIHGKMLNEEVVNIFSGQIKCLGK